MSLLSSLYPLSLSVFLFLSLRAFFATLCCYLLSHSLCIFLYPLLLFFCQFKPSLYLLIFFKLSVHVFLASFVSLSLQVHAFFVSFISLSICLFMPPLQLLSLSLHVHAFFVSFISHCIIFGLFLLLRNFCLSLFLEVNAFTVFFCSSIVSLFKSSWPLLHLYFSVCLPISFIISHLFIAPFQFLFHPSLVCNIFSRQCSFQSVDKVASPGHNGPGQRHPNYSIE